MARRKSEDKLDPNEKAFWTACNVIAAHPMFRPLTGDPTATGLATVRFEWREDAALSRARGWARIAPGGRVVANKHARGTVDEWTWVLAHCVLHLGFGHLDAGRPADGPYRAACCLVVTRFQSALRLGDRVAHRDPYLWNIATDYVINGWLVEMAVGEMPDGLLHDPTLRGMSSEEVYDRIAGDLRRLRKLATLRGRGRGDILDGSPRPTAAGVDLDEYYRRALLSGLAYHESTGRGLLPSGLVAEIRVLDQPPLPWDARLAQWFEEFVPSVQKRRSYARASRRQAATPDIPRPGWLRPEDRVHQSTFGVVLDTSGSMDNRLLGKALGAIASYSLARDVPAARVVFCDAAAYDAGYLPVAEIAGRVRVRGRGGTVLQPGINLLERADDFPPSAPILVITDGYCDALRVRREHAYLVPESARLPFTPKGPVFRLR
jgi:Putative metallopeptidase domain